MAETGAFLCQIAGVIAGRFLLFIGRFVFLIQNDQADIVDRRKDCRTRSDHDPRLAVLHSPPFIVPLALGQF